MWRKYYQLRISSPFQSLWTDFVGDAIAVIAHPLMYQYLADKIFEALIEKTFAEGQGAASVDSLTYEEANALRYVAGYVCFKVKKNIVASNNPTKNQLLLCLMDLCDEDEDVSQSADWVRAVDRGGLVHVSENTFLLF